MSQYLNHHLLINYFCHKPPKFKIALVDYESYEYYINFRHLYNKLIISKSQQIPSGHMSETPLLFPVIVRPKINLDGMGKEARLVSNLSEFNQIKSNHLFWVTKLKGNHYSVDIFINSYGILGTICFQGYPGSNFTFKYWEYKSTYRLPKSITMWIQKYLNNFKGVFNLEIIGDKIIECHLRMGDIIFFQCPQLMQKVIDCHLDKRIYLDALPKLFLIPIFVSKNKFYHLKKTDIWKAVNESNSRSSLKHYKIDSPSKLSNPPGGNRICICSFDSLSKGMSFKNRIYQNLN